MDAYKEAIYAAVSAIPQGRVSSYGQIAAAAGLPGAARLVGRVLKALPSETSLPWHRVLRGTGQLAFPESSRKFVEQKARLQAEGVLVRGSRVSLTSFY